MAVSNDVYMELSETNQQLREKIKELESQLESINNIHEERLREIRDSAANLNKQLQEMRLELLTALVPDGY